MKGGFIYLVIDKLVPALEKQGKQMWVPPPPLSYPVLQPLTAYLQVPEWPPPWWQ